MDVVIQAMLTMNRWKVPDAAGHDQGDDGEQPGARRAARRHDDAESAGDAGGGGGRGGAALDARAAGAARARRRRSTTSCASPATAPTGWARRNRSSATTMAPPLAGSPRVNGHRDYIIKAVLHGLTGPVDGRTYTDMMIPMGNNDDEWIAAVGVVRPRTTSATRGGFVTPADVARVRAGDRGPQDALDASGADGVAAGAALHRRLEGDGEPQPGGRDRRVDADGVERRRAAAAGHVVPGRAAEAGDGHRDPVPVAGARRPWRAGMPRRRRAAEHRPAAGRRAFRADSRSRSRRMARRGRRRRGQGQRPDDDRHVPARSRRSSSA